MKSDNRDELEALVRPLLEALATVLDLEATYLTILDWDFREAEVMFAFNADAELVTEGFRVPMPADLTAESFPGVTRSPDKKADSHPDSWVAQTLGLNAYVSAPVRLSKHRVFGMLCGASRGAKHISESSVSILESFAHLISESVIRQSAAATELRATNAEAQLKARGRFLALAEHQLKTPLAAVEGISQTLLKHWLEIGTAEREDFLAALVRNSRGLSRLVEDLLVEARADVRSRELRPEDVDLEPLLRMLAKAFGSLGRAHEIVVKGNLSAHALVDSAAIEQVLGHLLDNALKYSPKGGTITFTLEDRDPFIQIEVSDHGVGIPADVDVFQPFVRGDPHESTHGIGLGLHIVRSLTEAMGGTVTGRRNPGGGSTFTVSVPRVGAALEPAAFAR